MRLILLLVLGSLVSLQGVSQGRGNEPARLGEKLPLGHSMMECIYEYKVYDPLRDESREYFYILEMDKDLSRYSNYGTYMLDSIIATDYPDGLTRREYDIVAKGIKRRTLDEMVKYPSESTMEVYDKVFMDYYVYTDSVKDMNWRLMPETKVVCGNVCHRAEITYRGRNWTAWYCDIPRSDGPWKFGNLPGLILSVEDDKGEHVFNAVAIRKSDRDFGRQDRWYIKTTREKYNKSLKEYKENPIDFMKGSPYAPKDANGNIPKPVGRMFYNAIELD